MQHPHLKCHTIIGSLIVLVVINITQSTKEADATRPPRGFCGTIDLMAQNDPICHDYMLTVKELYEKNITNNNNLLVYYRLQTLGDRLDNLETMTINELLSRDLKRKLLLPKQDTTTTTTSNVLKYNPLDSYSRSDDRGATWRPESNQTMAGDQSRDSVELPNSITTHLLNSIPTITTITSSVTHQIDKLNLYLRENSHCAEAIMRYICRYLYPSCHYSPVKRGKVALVRPPCRQDCILLRDMYCAQVPWSVVIGGLVGALNSTLFEHVLPIDILAEGDGLSPTSQSVHYYWPHERSFLECDSLPLSTDDSYTSSSSSASSHLHPHPHPHPHQHQHQRSWPICSDAHLSRIDEQPTRNSNHRAGWGGQVEECRRGRGSNYKGRVSLTRSGRQCQFWKSQWPHQHNDRKELMFSEMIEVDPANYCRNPGGLELIPWCYTRDPLTRWEYCDIPECT